MHPLITRFAPLAVLASAGMLLAGWTAWRTTMPSTVAPPAAAPPRGPWAQRVSASGLIEGDGEEMRIGVPEAALVAEIAVRVGQRVAADEVLFRLDDRLLRAELAVADAGLAAADAGLALAEARAGRTAALPRPEDIAPVEARLAVAEARLADARIQRNRIDTLWDKQVTSASQVDVVRGAERIARAAVDNARADLAHARLAAWDRDLAIAGGEVSVARAAVAAAAARLAAVRTRLDRLTVRAPRAATVVDLGITVGALASPGDPRLVVLADLARLLVRAEVHESQAWRIRTDAPGRGWIRGDGAHPVDLAFERIEPRASTRRAINGQPGERLDGRVLHVLYRLIDPPPGMHPGFLLEIDIAAGDPPTATAPGPTTQETP